MDNGLEKLLNKTGIERSNYTFFNNGKLLGIITNDTKDCCLINIELESNLPVKIYLELKEKIINVFPNVQVNFKLKIKNINIHLFYDYLDYLIEENNIEVLKNNDNIVYRNNTLELQEENKLTTELENMIISNMKKFGYVVKIEYKELKKEEIRMTEPVVEQAESKQEEKPKFKNYERKPRVHEDHPDVIYGRLITDPITRMDTIVELNKTITVEAFIFGMEQKELKTKDGREFKILNLKLTDFTDSIYASMFLNANEEFPDISENNWYKIRAQVKEPDKYNPDMSLSIKDINKLDKQIEKIIDDAPVKRIELHAHTMMSQMDGVVNEEVLVKEAIAWGHKGIAITDHNGCQAFPHVFNLVRNYNKGKEEQDKFKVIYGTELTLIDDTVKIVVRPTNDSLLESTYVVFDLETTGFNAGGEDSIIEIGAVKIQDGMIIDRYDRLINPGKEISERITNVTNITNEMLKGKPNEEDTVKEFIEWVGDLPMVAHNAKFDTSFLEMAYKKYNLGEYKNTVIDTLELSRTMDNTFARHSLSALVKRYNVPFDEEAHHRADYDAEGTAYVFAKMLKKLESQKFEKISDLDKLVSKEEIYKFGRTYHFNAIALNKKGLKNLFEIISLANTVYIYKTPRILRSKLEELREGLLIGSGCYESEVFTEARSKEGQELTNIINFYDYVEVQPPEVYGHLLQLGDFKDETELQNHIKKIIDATESAGKIIVATGDVHHFKREDKIYRQIIVNQKVPGGGRHPLAKNDIKEIPSQHFRTTREMLENFSFLGTDLAYKIVVENTNKIADMVEEIEVIPDTGGTQFSPRVKSDDGTCYLDCPRVVTDLVYNKAKFWYGEPLPHSIEERIATELYGDIVLNTIKAELKDKPVNDVEKEAFKGLHEVIVKGFDSVKELLINHMKKEEPELSDDEINKKLKKSLGGVIGAGFDPIYLIAQRLVKHSNDEGFLVGSRGSVGSSFVATLMGITEVNPLPAHYRCSECKISIFEENGKPLGEDYSCGFDLPDKMCPNCNIPLIKDGQDMPFATFLGFNADKVPDIVLNFSDLNQASTHAYTKVLFGADNVYRAGTIGTVADKTAFGFVKGYCEDKNIVMRTAEVERLALGCTGVKRTTGQHPGGIVVIPDYMNCFDFTPFQFPAEDPNSPWRTTHFDYHSIEECVLKLDILGHSDPTQLRLIQLQSGTDIMKVPMDDKETMSIFTSTKALGVTKEQILCNTGTLGIPEFGTPFTIKLVEDTKPTTFAELVKISGLSHGTDVWLGNAQELIQNNVVPFKETIGCRDDIMVYLMYRGLAPIKAFKIMEFVRKGKASKDPETWKEHVKTMEEANIPKWFIDSCQKIKYMFPKAHAAAYVISAFRIAWYKVHMPVYFYASWFSSKATDVDVEVMIKGYDAIKNKIIEIQNKGYDATNKELGQLESLKVALEATARGIKFVNIDLYKSEAKDWLVKSDNEIYPPFNSIDGLGEAVAQAIVDERNKKEFMSIEDAWKRSKISATLVEKMRFMGIFDGMDESSQLSLF